MTDRVKGFTVILDDDIRTDDVEPLMNAIACLKHVIKVEPSITTPDDHMARERVRLELGQKLWDVLYPKK